VRPRTARSLRRAASVMLGTIKVRPRSWVWPGLLHRCPPRSSQSPKRVEGKPQRHAEKADISSHVTHWATVLVLAKDLADSYSSAPPASRVTLQVTEVVRLASPLGGEGVRAEPVAGSDQGQGQVRFPHCPRRFVRCTIPLSAFGEIRGVELNLSREVVKVTGR
jgi:hypothetical protein